LTSASFDKTAELYPIDEYEETVDLDENSVDVIDEDLINGDGISQDLTDNFKTLERDLNHSLYNSNAGLRLLAKSTVKIITIDREEHKNPSIKPRIASGIAVEARQWRPITRQNGSRKSNQLSAQRLKSAVPIESETGRRN
jgi:hypothetical protein